MRVHASGVGKTLSLALDKVREELKHAALHEHEVTDEMRSVKDGKVFVDPEKARVENHMAADLEGALVRFTDGIEAVDGHLFRVLVSKVSNDRERSHFTLSVDFIRE